MSQHSTVIRLSLEFSRSRSFIGLQTDELVAPPVAGLLGHSGLPAGIGDGLSLTLHPICPQLSEGKS
jgi:hypothetical protein